MGDEKELYDFIMNNCFLFIKDINSKDEIYNSNLFNFRILYSYPYYLDLASKLLYEKIKDLDYDYIGGTETGSLPLIYSLSRLSGKRGFYVRKKLKHKLRPQIEGIKLKAGDKVILVDDIIHSGTGIKYSYDEVKKYGCNVVALLSILVFKNKKIFENIFQFNLFSYSKFAPLIEIKNVKNNIIKSKKVFNGIKEGVFSTKIISYNDKYYMSTLDGHIICFDKNLDIIFDVLYSKHFKDFKSNFMVKDNCLVLGSYYGFIIFIDSETGKFVKKINPNDFCISSFIHSDIVKENDGYYFSSEKYALDKSFNGVLCKYDNNDEKVWDFHVNGYLPYQPIINENELYFGDNLGVVRKLDKNTGKEIWSCELKSEIRAILYYEKRLIVLDYSGKLHCIIDGVSKWNRLINTNFNICVFDTKIIIPSRSNALLQIDLYGKLLSVKRFDELVFNSGFSIYNDKLYASTNKGVFVIDNGEISILKTSSSSIKLSFFEDAVLSRNSDGNIDLIKIG
jgi:orotate phosphoribosyltransferase